MIAQKQKVMVNNVYLLQYRGFPFKQNKGFTNNSNWAGKPKFGPTNGPKENIS
jgi:hypothetical protein